MDFSIGLGEWNVKTEFLTKNVTRLTFNEYIMKRVGVAP